MSAAETSFNTLDYTAQVQRLDALAAQALTYFDLGNAAWDLISYTNNAIYKVVLDDTRYVLRVHRPHAKKLAWIESERVWLTALRDETPLRVPRPALSVYQGALAGVDVPVYCDLLEWLSGDAPALATMTLDHVQAIGAFAAHLHQFAFDVPDDFVRPRLDHGALFGTQAADGTPSPYNPGAGERFFTDAQREVMTQVGERVQHSMDALGDGDNAFGLIHADLLPANLLLGANDSTRTLGVVDFDDCAFGYYLYDLAPMLWASRAYERAEAIREALWHGYTDVRALADDQHEHMEAMLAARHVASCRWVAGNASNPSIGERARDIIAARVDEMRAYLKTGRLQITTT